MTLPSSIPPVFPVTLLPSGWTFTASAGVTVLRAAALADIKLPSSCRNGTCRACMCRMAGGQVEYRIERPGLSRDEIEEGWILPCVAHAAAELCLEAPDASPVDRTPPLPIATGPRLG